MNLHAYMYLGIYIPLFQICDYFKVFTYILMYVYVGVLLILFNNDDSVHQNGVT